jgi:hypothetical protein
MRSELLKDSRLGDGRFATFCASRAARVPDVVLPLSEAIFEYDLNIHGQPRAIPHGKPITNVLQIIGCSEGGQWQFVLPLLQYYRLSKDGDPLNSYVDNVLLHRVNSGRMLYQVHVLEGDVVDTLSSEFAAQSARNAPSALAGDAKDESELNSVDNRGEARRPRPLDLIGKENQRRVSAGIARAKIGDEAADLLKWSREHQPEYVATFASDAACIASIRTRLYKMQNDWAMTAVMPLNI